MTELTGGIAMKLSLTWLNINKMGKDAFIEFVKTYLHKNALFCTGNAGDGKVKEGKARDKFRTAPDKSISVKAAEAAALHVSVGWWR